MLVPLLLNVHINELFFFILNDDDDDDDTTLRLQHILMNKLESGSEKAIGWFEYNYMKLNSDKCHILIVGSNTKLLLGISEILI